MSRTIFCGIMEQNTLTYSEPERKSPSPPPVRRDPAPPPPPPIRKNDQ